MKQTSLVPQSAVELHGVAAAQKKPGEHTAPPSAVSKQAPFPPQPAQDGKEDPLHSPPDWQPRVVVVVEVVVTVVVADVVVVVVVVGGAVVVVVAPGIVVVVGGTNKHAVAPLAIQSAMRVCLHDARV